MASMNIHRVKTVKVHRYFNPEGYEVRRLFIETTDGQQLELYLFGDEKTGGFIEDARCDRLGIPE